MYILYFQNDLYNIIWDSEIIHIKWQNPSKVMRYDEFHIKSNPKYKTVGPQLMHSDKGQNQCVDAQQKCLRSYGYTFVVYQIVSLLHCGIIHQRS